MYEIYFKCDFCGDTISRDTPTKLDTYLRNRNKKTFAYASLALTLLTYGDLRHDDCENKNNMGPIVLCKECYKKILKLKEDSKNDED